MNKFTKTREVKLEKLFKAIFFWKNDIMNIVIAIIAFLTWKESQRCVSALFGSD
jgi:hypothetical protein